ncbi:hypothetical protein FNW52_01940 [Flavobacterium sp. ZT3R18]|uniref:hypothetical protein n=1 Tax=Flavobacterium sp. ZT3R18 TaxID=2594429 RepID=UPI00117A5AE5|nr:hypothetical protein [Flavobacterium sp. ZT3R18]TRX38830.1 hypothetical protein FNW52_01940 [Flavobacterium sp. ZT3R18]
MVVQYQGEQNGIPTTFTIKINGDNLSKSSSNYQIDLLVGDKQLPVFTTLIHQSLSNCLKEIYLFRKYNGIRFDSSSEEVVSKVVLYDLALYNHNKNALFMV